MKEWIDLVRDVGCTPVHLGIEMGIRGVEIGMGNRDGNWKMRVGGLGRDD